MTQERNTNGQFKKVYRYKTRAEYEKELERLEEVRDALHGRERLLDILREEKEQLSKRFDWLYAHSCWFVRRRFDKLF